jgi:exonuclease SbcC
MKFAHLADTHIRNLKYHEEYRVVFERLYAKLREENPDCIVHCGDIAHTKTQISPEFVEMCSDFFKNLADIAPTYIILGNHDGNLKNSSRQDALTPIVKALDHKSLFLLKKSGETKLNDGYTFNVLSVFDEDGWQEPSNKHVVNIALYHGSISGITTDTGWKMENGENDVSIFDDFDYAFLGDIHKTNQVLDKKGKVRYPGSTIQQNHGESNDKGFLVWNIEDKNNFTCEHHAIQNPKPFLTIKLTKNGQLPKKVRVTPGSRLRLATENNLPLDVIRKAIDSAKHRFQPESVTFLNRALDPHRDIDGPSSGLGKKDLRNLEVQEKLIFEYLEDFKPDDDTLKKVYEINRKYNSMAEAQEEIQRNINWRLHRLEWDNLFNYGEDNVVNFAAKSGVVGILGKNFSGKSSIIDALLYALYNTTSKGNRKNLNVINQHKDLCRGYVEINVGSKRYCIERSSEKYKRRLKGKETMEAKTDVNFWVVDTLTDTEKSLNGITRNETDKNIRKLFGTVDDFLTTSMASQLESLSYINEGSTRRKEILAKFLDLELFDQKFKFAKEDSTDLKGAIKKLSGRNFDEEIENARTESARSQTELMVSQRELEEYEREKDSKQVALSMIRSKISLIPTEVAEADDVDEKLVNTEDKVASTKKRLTDSKVQYKSLLETYKKIDQFVESFDIDVWREKSDDVEKTQEDFRKIEKELEEILALKQNHEAKLGLLQKVPCNSALQKQCMFVKDAHKSHEDMERTIADMEQLLTSKEGLVKKIDDLVPSQVFQYISQYEQALERKNQKIIEIANIELEIEKLKSKLSGLKSQKSDLLQKQKEQEENAELIKQLKDLKRKERKLESDYASVCAGYTAQNDLVLNLYKTAGSNEQKLEEIINQKNEYSDLEDEYAMIDLFMRCMHSNGISYSIIKKQLPIINDEISKVLANIVDFEVFFENGDRRLDILIQHPGHSTRSIEMASGAEKTIAAMAIRLALLNVSTLPKSDIFVLDEPGTSLDADNMEGFIRILDMVKTQFKTVLLISHLDSLKDIVDQQIFIDNKNGFASVQEK